MAKRRWDYHWKGKLWNQPKMDETYKVIWRTKMTPTSKNTWQYPDLRQPGIYRKSTSMEHKAGQKPEGKGGGSEAEMEVPIQALSTKKVNLAWENALAWGCQTLNLLYIVCQFWRSTPHCFNSGDCAFFADSPTDATLCALKLWIHSNIDVTILE